MSDSSGLKTVHLTDYPPVSQEVLDSLPLSLVRQKLIVPVSKSGGRLTAAVPNAEGIVKPQGLQMIAHCPVDLVLAPLDEIIAHIKKYYGDELSEATAYSNLPDVSLPEPFRKLIEDSLVNKASELLIENANNKIRIRQRIRGVLITELQSKITPEKIKELFDLVRKGARPEHKKDGTWAQWTFGVPFRNGAVECVAVLSETKEFSLLTIHFRIQEVKMFSPASWGMGPHQARALENMLQKKQGVVLFCGLETDDFRANIRACAKELATAERHVIAVSNSGAEWLPGVEHFVADGSDANFTELLKLAFRHKPDLLLVDALEKAEDRDLVLREAMKGPLVLSHVYGRDASEAFVSLLGGKTDPPLVGTALLGVVAQRSLRLICPRCQEKDSIHRDRIRDMGIPVAMQPPAFYRGKGCDACFKTGFDREANIFEVIEMTDGLRALLNREMRPEEIRTYFKSSGFLSLRQVAIHKAVNGQTSLSEVLRVTP